LAPCAFDAGHTGTIFPPSDLNANIRRIRVYENNRYWRWFRELVNFDGSKNSF
jgi:hypothetical protein